MFVDSSLMSRQSSRFSLSLVCLLSVFVAVAVDAYPTRDAADLNRMKSLYYSRSEGIPESQYQQGEDGNLLLYLLAKSDRDAATQGGKGGKGGKYFHYASKKSLDKIGGGNLIKRDLIGHPDQREELERALFNNELPCVFEFYVNGQNEVVMVCKPSALQQD